jgi:hypothetical protein
MSHDKVFFCTLLSADAELTKRSTLQFDRAIAANGNRKSTGSNFACALRCGFFSQSFSQSSSDGTVTSACFEQA